MRISKSVPLASSPIVLALALGAGLLFALLIATSANSATPLASWPPDGRAIATRGIPPDVPSCTSCHGQDLSGRPSVGAPSLRGKAAEDLMDDLYTMAKNPKNHSAMAQIARHLNMAERAAVTAYIDHLPSGAR